MWACTTSTTTAGKERGQRVGKAYITSHIHTHLGHFYVWTGSSPFPGEVCDSVSDDGALDDVVVVVLGGWGSPGEPASSFCGC